MSFLDEEFIKIAKMLGGEEAVKVVKVLKELKEATDEVIANNSKVRINDVRKILYKLYDYALISCTRISGDKAGWYTFYWKLLPDQVDAFIRSRKRRVLEKLKARLKYENLHNFFVCKKCPDVRVTFEEATESAFRCTSCSGQLINADNSDLKKVLNELISKLEAELSS
ncbi:MAG: transcription factor [Candidatus Bathyarchaeia archaeon]